MKKFKKKKLPIKMNTMKKPELPRLTSFYGPLSFLVTSIAWYMMSGQPSSEATIKSVIIASLMLSKFESNFFHSPPWSSQTH